MEDEATGPGVRVVRSDFVTSAHSPGDLPKSNLPEVAFVGRSNAGKSSFLNALLGRKNLARVSKTPGRTQAVNYFSVGIMRGEEESKEWAELLFADFPGYGFAKVSKEKRGEWGEWLYDVLERRPQIVRVFLLMDVRRRLEGEEEVLVSRLSSKRLSLVLTKADQLSRQEIWHKREEVKQRHPSLSEVFVATVEGKEKFDLELLRQSLGDLPLAWKKHGHDMG